MPLFTPEKNNTGQLKQLWLCKLRPAYFQNRYLPKLFLYHWAVLSVGAELSMTPAPIQSLSLCTFHSHILFASLILPGLTLLFFPESFSHFIWDTIWFIPSLLLLLSLTVYSFSFSVYYLLSIIYFFNSLTTVFLFSMETPVQWMDRLNYSCLASQHWSKSLFCHSDKKKPCK